jgi:acetyl/propionyl-CoA carboxylase alpha subunit
VKLAELDWATESPLARVVFTTQEEGDKEAIVQYEGRASQLSYAAGTGSNAGEKYQLRIYGSQQHVIVRTPEEHALSKHMIAPEVKDTSKLLLCPMPGSLISVGTLQRLCCRIVVVGNFVATCRRTCRPSGGSWTANCGCRSNEDAGL